MSTSRIREAIAATSESLSEKPELARGETTAAVATLEEDLSFRVTGSSGELVRTDMPSGVGGRDTTPQPGWLMRAGLASCTATCIAMNAAQRGIDLSRLEVAVSGQVDKRGMLGIEDDVSPGMSPLRLHVKIDAPNASEEELRELVRWGRAHSPVACTDLSAVEVEIQVG